MRATLTMIVCWFIGRGIGGLVQRDVDEQIEKYKLAHPMPENRGYGEASDEDEEDEEAAEEEGELREVENGRAGSTEDSGGQRQPQPEVTMTTTAGT